MYFDWQTWWTLRDAAAEDGLRRRAYFAATQAILLAARGVASLGRGLDDLLVPAYARVEVRRPVFIYASPRSGTTYLHRLLGLDEARFTHVKLYQTILQSVTLTRAVEAVGALDPRLDGRLGRALDAIDARCFGGWRDVHPMGLRQAEEDEMYFVLSLLSPGAVLFYPWLGALERAFWLDRVEPAARRAVMADFRSGIQRHLYAVGGGRTFLDKSVLLPGRIEAMLETFPDARFIYLVRNPYDAIPSFVSMFSSIWRALWPERPKATPETRALAQLAVEYYRSGLAVRRRLSDERFFVLRYEDLVAAPRRQVERIYAHFGWEIGDEFATRLNEQEGEMQSYRPRHRYALEEYGLTRGELRAALAEVFEEFGVPCAAPRKRLL
ncbi:MAG TPA: sulfotransferase, partial [Polyangiaceae bacterium]|nr:sulfotransferase [Polyangiaceae bacterium]